MNVLTGIDLPLQPSCGSLILSHDLYTGWPGTVQFFGITPHDATLFPEAEVLDWPEHDARLATDRRPYIRALARRLARQLSRAEPDVYHMHHLTYGATRAALESLPPSAPVVAICHGTDLLAARHSGAHRETVRRALDRADVTIFPTRAMWEEAKTLGAPPDRAQITPWGLPQAAFRPRQAPWGETLRILYAGRLTPNKGAHTVLQTLTTHPKWSGTLVGPKEGHPHLRAPPNAILRDFMTRAALWDLFEEHDVLVVPTTEVEAFGLTAIEAQARGLPVVYARVPGLAEVLGSSGLGYEPGDARDLGHALEAMSHALEAFSERGRQNARPYRIEATRAALLDASNRARVRSLTRTR